MAKLSDLCRHIPSEFAAQNIWAMIDPNGGRVPKKHGQSTPRRETAGSIFADCKGYGVRKRVRANCTPSTGSIVVGVRVGTYTTCVCKCKL